MAKLVGLIALVLAARLCHADLLWIEEAYPTAAAAEVLRGKALYRDIWFDKPPLYALVYVIWGAKLGVPLRVAGALYVLLCAALAYFFARGRWGEREGYYAAGLLSLFLTFGIPSSVMALAPDLLTVAPHLASVYLAWRGRPFWAGMMAGVSLLFNVKGVFVFAAALVFAPSPLLLAGFAVPAAILLLFLSAAGALNGYIDQVWRWGFLYSGDTPFQPLSEGIRRTLNWSGFHATAVVGALLYFRRESDRKMLAWAVISLVAVAGGWRFFPRYYFHLLPVAVLAGARGLSLAPPALRWALLLLLLLPVGRFAPRYVSLATGGSQNWSDLALMNDSKEAAGYLKKHSQPGDTMVVWGYRPDLYAFSGLPAGTRFLDSQPLTGVLADRHLASSKPTAPEWAARNRIEIDETKPNWIADGLGPYNPELAVTRFRSMSGYEEVHRTKGFALYRRRSRNAAMPCCASSARAWRTMSAVMSR